MDNGQENNAPRATIIVDSSAFLKGLNMPVSEELLTDPGSGKCHYVDLLSALAHRGFKIVIPEIVMIESANMLKDGTDLDRYFPQSEPHEIRVGAIKRFLLEVINRPEEHPGISIRGSDDAPEMIRDYVQRFHDAVRRHGTSHSRMRKEIAMNFDSVNKEGFGDAVIEEMMRNEYASAAADHRAFVLTNDNRMIRRLGGLDKAVTPRQFIYSVADAGLHADIGIHAHAQKGGLEQDMLRDESVSPFQCAQDYRSHPFFERLTEAMAAGAAPKPRRSQTERLAAQLTQAWGRQTQRH